MPIDESHPQTPVNPYGESKLFVERILRWYGQAYDLRSVALRYFNASGADPEGTIGEDHDPETHLIPLVIDARSGKRPPVGVFGTDYPTPDGTAIRDYIHVMDLADAHVGALDYLAGGGATTAINLGTGQGRSVRAVIRDRRAGGRTGACRTRAHRAAPETRRSSSPIREGEGRPRLVAAVRRPADDHRARVEVAHQT